MLLPAVIWICECTRIMKDYWLVGYKMFLHCFKSQNDYSELALKNLLLIFTRLRSISVKIYGLVWLEHSLLPVIIKETYHFTSHFWLVLAIDNYPNKNGYWKSLLHSWYKQKMCSEKHGIQKDLPSVVLPYFRYIIYSTIHCSLL